MQYYDQQTTKTSDFSAIRLKLASPEGVLSWSHGEVTRPETINYRTQKPEKDGLFCERIFGPSKDWECYCGKYKRIRYKGIVCDKCGVEVTRAVVRRERFGHIKLAAPVSHIWFLRGVPSKIGLILNMSVQQLEKVVYFANFIVTDVNEELREQTLEQIDQEATAKKKQIKNESTQAVGNLKQRQEQELSKAKNEKEKISIGAEYEQEFVNAAVLRDEKIKDVDDAVDMAKRELKELEPLLVISESQYQDLSLKYGHVFEAGIGAEAIYGLLTRIELDALINQLQDEMKDVSKNQRHRIVRRLKLAMNLKKNGIKPEWMVMSVLPVVPPDIRPMVQLDGGRFAASDLNDLYRRVINRNNRLKRLIELNAPEVIQRNEKRMLQEAVDALIDNQARHGKTTTSATGQKRMLKSMADMLKGKQGRFRQNLLGKRVDYSGRSVIVVGPHLKLSECGLPKRMALELFKPFVISKLIARELVYNVRSANRFIESNREEVWDILEEITKQSHVLLNRAPTLHRLGIQAFRPVLIEGKAIQVHPLVCPAFNADFDGDQMAVHVPLTEEAKREAAEIMLSSKNLLKPATGEPIVTPAQDIVLGAYYMTTMDEDKDGAVKKHFADANEAIFAYQLERIALQTKIFVRMVTQGKSEMVETTVGRIIFNTVIPEDLRFINKKIDKKGLKKVIADVFAKYGNDRTVELLDDVKDTAIYYITKSGMSWGMGDVPVPARKKEILEEAQNRVDEVQAQYEIGLLTNEERREKVVESWTKAKNEITEVSKETLDKKGPAFAMIDSGARGSWGQTTQMMGMKGLVINPSGEIIELPVKASFKEGFDVLEYFISTHGARKGLSDTALRTANAGYLTRRLVDVAQDVVINTEDCGATIGLEITEKESKEMGEDLAARIVGRHLAKEIKVGRKTLFKVGHLISDQDSKLVAENKVETVEVRSPLTCDLERGICQACYGFDLGSNSLVKLGTAVGIIAAQSIGEPGTQLTMRTFHTGGVAGSDITQGLPRVEELLEARPLKKFAALADVDGKVEEIVENGREKTLRVAHIEHMKETHHLGKDGKAKVKDGAKVSEGDVIIMDGSDEVKAATSGLAHLVDGDVVITSDQEAIKEYIIPAGYGLWVKQADLVTKGQQLSEGSLDLYQLHALRGKAAVEKYIVKEIQYIYSSQGQKLNDKHIEIIIRQIFSRYIIKDPGDTELVTGDVVSWSQVKESNGRALEAKLAPAQVENVLLGITKASLSTDSFLSAASFQETARILIDAAISGKIDHLRGLKENVIIGKLIPVGTGFNRETAAAQLAPKNKVSKAQTEGKE